MMVLALCGLSLAACGGSSRFYATQAPTESFNRYGKVQVNAFSVGAVEGIAPEDKQALAEFSRQIGDSLRGRLEKQQVFPGAGNTLVIDGKIVGYDPGSRTARYLVGFGAGEGEIMVEVTFSNSRGGVVAKGSASGTVSGGFFGGSGAEAAERVVNAIVDFIRNNRG